MARLETEGVTVRFGGSVALDEVRITAEAGEVTGLIGPNGAGKTTLFNVVTGLLAPSAGRVVLDGKDLKGMAPYRRAQLGLSRTFQRLELFVSLSVRDNVRVAGDVRNAWGRARRVNVEREVDRIIELTGLGDIADRDVVDIPTGRARIVEVARALMTGPRVLLLDEPASGQTEQETVAFGRLLRRLADQDGLAVCLVEHDVSLVMDVCARIHVLDYGRILAVGTPAEIRANGDVVEAYLGTTESVP